ncbi:uncharacterized protein LOC121866052 isoform X3 [Homarus americanus]|uniref:Uncharacterized protein n=1 Tax=Homarus americanus TaxID=6706 RepID=A0A8J5MZL6_HOMAM|nr:uncharacterized protein LOC121866052 isoform X2 [Homarus americanus]XP_042221568.1 uncharacterized protein LOC121866052 isoform X3 [Homarus americanus]KAG7169251.1 hypothetical protein Hamer_G020940 [Homarus americanus]
MGCCKCCCFTLLVIIIIVAISSGLLTAFFPYPSHASCRVDWIFGKPCSDVKSTLISQMKAWSHDDCSLKQQCNYEYLGEEGSTIRGLHVTPWISFVDKINFTFNAASGGNCYVQAASESAAAYAVIDFGVNYCNLRNLVIGSKLDENDSSYKENSTNAVCTMYSIAHCNLYT